MKKKSASFFFFERNFKIRSISSGARLGRASLVPLSAYREHELCETKMSFQRNLLARLVKTILNLELGRERPNKEISRRLCNLRDQSI